MTTSTLREHLEADGEDIESYVRGARVRKRTEIPSDIETLKRLFIEQRLTIRAKDMEIEHLRLQVARLRRMKFGQSSERFIGNVEQLGLLDPTSAVAELPPLSSSPESDAQVEPARKRPVREALPDYLPRESVVHPSPCHCPGCGGKLRKIGTVTTEMLEIVPTRLKVRRHLRDKFSCKTCDTVVASPPPVKPIPNSYVRSAASNAGLAQGRSLRRYTLG